MERRSPSRNLRTAKSADLRAGDGYKREIRIGSMRLRIEMESKRDLVVFPRAEALHGEGTDQDDGYADDGPLIHIQALDKRVGSIQ